MASHEQTLQSKIHRDIVHARRSHQAYARSVLNANDPVYLAFIGATPELSEGMIQAKIERDLDKRLCDVQRAWDMQLNQLDMRTRQRIWNAAKKSRIIIDWFL